MMQKGESGNGPISAMTMFGFACRWSSLTQLLALSSDGCQTMIKSSTIWYPSDGRRKIATDAFGDVVRDDGRLCVPVVPASAGPMSPSTLRRYERKALTWAPGNGSVLGPPCPISRT